MESPGGTYLVNKRPVWYPLEYAADGFHVSSDGYLVAASGFGVDVLTPYGELVLRIQTDFIVVNANFAGVEYSDLWLFGNGKVARVKWALVGLDGARS